MTDDDGSQAFEVGELVTGIGVVEMVLVALAGIAVGVLIGVLGRGRA